MTRAWILPGGASFGAVQVGVAQALLDRGRRPDLLVGTSIGAFNAAWLAQDPTPHGAAALRDIWHGLRRGMVLPLRPFRLAAGLAGLGRYLVENDAMANWLRNLLPYELIEDTTVPLTITATDLTRAEPVFLDRGDVVRALLASSAMPGILPPVRFRERWLVDGWLMANAPLGYAIEHGADEVYVLPCGGAEPYEPVSKRATLTRFGASNSAARTRTLAKFGVPRRGEPLSEAVIGSLVARGVRHEFSTWTPQCDLFLPPGPSTHGLSPYSFAESAGLIAAARQLAAAWLPSAKPLTDKDLAAPRALAGVDD
jgi:NTE family protein